MGLYQGQRRIQLVMISFYFFGYLLISSQMSSCSKIPNMKILSALTRDSEPVSQLSRDLSDRVTKEILLVTLPHLMKSGHRSIEQNKRTFDSTDKKIRNRFVRI